MDKLVIKLQKDNMVIGSYLYYGRKNIHDVLLMMIMPFINNYNKELANSSLIGPLFAVRFFNKENVSGIRVYSGERPYLLDKSREFINKHYPDFHLSDAMARPDDICLAIANSDMSGDFNDATTCVLIDLDANKIRMYGFYDEEKASEYTKRTGYHISKLKVCPFDFYNLPFNEISDFCEFMWFNREWKYETRKDVVGVMIE